MGTTCRSVEEARKWLRENSDFTIRKFANHSWDNDVISGFERGGNERVFEIRRVR